MPETKVGADVTIYSGLEGFVKMVNNLPSDYWSDQQSKLMHEGIRDLIKKSDFGKKDAIVRVSIAPPSHKSFFKESLLNMKQECRRLMSSYGNISMMTPFPKTPRGIRSFCFFFESI